MKKLANIVTNERKTEYGNIYNVVNSCDKIDNELPTLYIGLKVAKKCIENFNILDKFYPGQNCWWTFSKNEMRNDYVNDVAKFQEDIIAKSLNEIKYKYVNFITYTLNRIKKFIFYIKSNDEKLCFLTRDSKFIFIYDSNIKCVFGLSLTLCEYCGIDKRKVIERIKNNTHNKFIYDTSFLTVDAKRIIGNNTHYILPMFEYFN